LLGSNLITARILRSSRRCLFFGVVLWGGGFTSCTPASPQELTVATWSASDAAAISLEQTLRVEFSSQLSPQVRQASIAIEDTRGLAVGDYQIDVAGTYLSLIPTLPKKVDCSDSGFPPGQELRLRLRGLPSLAALSSTDGAVLHDDVVLLFRTLDVEEPEALSGFVGGDNFFHITTLGDVGRQILIPENGFLKISFSHPIDPRSINAPAKLKIAGDNSEKLVHLVVEQNARDGSQVSAEIGELSKWAVLELPESLQSFGGFQLPPGQNQLRIAPRAQQSLEKNR